MDPNEDRGWAKYKSFLLPEVAPSLRSLVSWRSNYYTTLRRRWDLFVINEHGDHCRGATPKCDPIKTKPHYKKKRYDEEYGYGGRKGIRVFIVDAGNPERPVRCQLEKDDEDRWRVRLCL